MDFFAHEDRARRNTTRLVVLFALGVIGTIAATYLVIAFVLGFVQHRADGQIDPASLVRLDLLAGVGLSVLAVVSAGSLYKMAQLSGGGSVIAIHLGGRPVEGNTTDEVERRVLNVVEEMAIASGMPVPPVYMLDREPGINAFAAGHSASDAVIGITRGCAEKLTRDQLQGVIAHEFSHILNGDTRLNIRLMGAVHGILLIGLIGYYIFRITAGSGGGPYSGSGRDRERGNPLPFIALGIGLMIVGFIGTLFGNLIKAAASRQREFLADASAVQFTRNPEGIGGALKVIGGFANAQPLTGAARVLYDGDANRSHLYSPAAPVASHMFFAEGVSSLFATHPPLEERIRRIDQYWEMEKAGSAANRGKGRVNP